jgi:hypothetical protein
VKIFSGSSREEANRKAEEWFAKQNGLQLIKRTELQLAMRRRYATLAAGL